MTTIIDLGGAPAEEPCAQLGQTPNFAALNAIEVDVYRAALQARHGAAPDGCRFVPIHNHHDFGSYLTLGLAMDHPEDPAVRSYAEAVEEGLGTWIEAGFAPPVTYQGAVGHAARQDVAEIVVGALGTTRPGFDGGFALEDFAILHRNLRAAYPTETARFDALGTAAAVPTATDPRFADEVGAPLADVALARAVCRAAIDALAPPLEAVGITRVVIDYDGYGDSGQINEVAASDDAGNQIALPSVECERFVTEFGGSVVVTISSLEAAIEEFGYEALAAYHSGWETNDGSSGKLTIDVAARTATLGCSDILGIPVAG